MILISNLSIAHGERTLYKDVTLSLDSSHKKAIALLGDNGSGKSTLFECILGRQTPDSGTITTAREIIGYIPQDVTLDDTVSVYDYLSSFLEEEWMAYQIELLFEELSIPGALLSMPCNTLSGGESMKVRIVGELLKTPTIILFDEPTNHLDAEGRLWLGKFIISFKGSSITITHDRAFIDQYLNEIWWIDPYHETIIPHTGNYSEFLEWKDAEAENRARAFEKEDRERRAIARWLDINELSSKYRFSNTVLNRKKALDRLENSETKPPVSKSQLSLVDMENAQRGTLIALTMDQHPHISAHFPLQCSIKPGERVQITGPNGSGKSTLLHLLAQEALYEEYGITAKPGLGIAMLEQHPVLEDNVTVLEAFDTLHGRNLSEPQTRSILASFGYKGKDLTTKIASLSLGERRKLELQILLLSKPDLLLLDEPTNHMDITTREEIESYLLGLPIALVYVSHDGYFAHKIGRDKEVRLGVE